MTRHPHNTVMLKVGIFDDQDVIILGLSALVETDPTMRVAVTGHDGRDYVRAVESGESLDVALLDLRMPGLDGLEALRVTADLLDRPPTLVVTTFEDADAVVDAISLGAAGYVLKRATRNELLGAIRAVAHGNHVLSPQMARSMLTRAVSSPGTSQSVRLLHGQGLTEREAAVLVLIGAGATNPEIATELFISESTVKTHVGNLLSKTQCRDRVALALLARGYPSDEGRQKDS